jgi:hypothetical protein
VAETPTRGFGVNEILSGAPDIVPSWFKRRTLRIPLPPCISEPGTVYPDMPASENRAIDLMAVGSTLYVDVESKL